MQLKSVIPTIQIANNHFGIFPLIFFLVYTLKTEYTLNTPPPSLESYW